MAEELSYKLEAFEGPLDLLLHLIEKDKINIYDIPIAHITAQYLDYMRKMDSEDLNLMSEFLVMAATLLDIKARLLLPKEIDEETGEEVDPRTELVERLIEHKRYLRLSRELADMEFEAEKLLYKPPTIPKEVSGYTKPVDLDELFYDVNLLRLQTIFEQVLRRQNSRIDPERSRFGTIKREPVSLEQKIGSLMSYAREKRRFSFRNLLKSQPSRTEVVITFLAVLELMKIGKISLRQENAFDDMEIETIEEEGKESELDLSGIGEI